MASSHYWNYFLFDRVCSYFFKMASGPWQRAPRAMHWRPLVYIMHSCVENRSHIHPNWSWNTGGRNIDIFRSTQFSLLNYRVSPVKLIPSTKIYCRMATHVFCHYWPWKVMSKFMVIVTMDAMGLLEEKLHTDYLHTFWLFYWLS